VKNSYLESKATNHSIQPKINSTGKTSKHVKINYKPLKSILTPQKWNVPYFESMISLKWGFTEK